MNKIFGTGLVQPMPRSTNPDLAEENARKAALRKERQAQHAIEAPAAMADYKKAADNKLRRMFELRAERVRSVAAKENG
jgi:hypothetical protein